MPKHQQRSDGNRSKEPVRTAPKIYTDEEVERIRKEYELKFSEMEHRILKTIENAVGPKSSESPALRIPLAYSNLSWIEKATPRQLIELIGSSLTDGPKKPDDNTLFMAWGTLFSILFLSSSDLQTDIDTISQEDRELLQKVIHEDCRRNGKFVFSIIKKGANLDRSALVMIGDLSDLARIEQDGESAINLLIKTCEKSIRPVLIHKAGKRILAGVYDRHGLPVIFTLFDLSDLSAYDIHAIEKVFTKEELKKVVPKSGLGRSAFDAYTEIETRIRENLALQRKSFLNARAGAAENGAGTAGSQEQDDESTGVLVHVRNDTKTAPGSHAQAQPGGNNTPAAQGGGPSLDKSILIHIVDDSKIMRTLLRERLQTLGYENIIESESGDEALKTARDASPFVIFMDVNMPGELDGIDAAREIRKETDTRIIFLTSNCNKETIDRAKNVNPQGYILKPFSERDIRIALTLLH